MARFADRVAVSSSSSGLGDFVLGAPLISYQAFSTAFTNGPVPYGIVDETTGEWEIGAGTLNGTLLARTTVLSSSSGGGAVNFAAGLKTVYSPDPAAWRSLDQGSFVWPVICASASALMALSNYLGVT